MARWFLPSKFVQSQRTIVMLDISSKLILNSSSESHAIITQILIVQSLRTVQIFETIEKLWSKLRASEKFCEICSCEWVSEGYPIVPCSVPMTPRALSGMIMTRDHIHHFEYFHPITIPWNYQWWLVMLLWLINFHRLIIFPMTNHNFASQPQLFIYISKCVEL